MATRFVFLIALSFCIIPSLIPVTTAKYHVKGCVYCDTCRAGFETNVTTYIEGARVGIRCIDRTNKKVVFYTEGETNHKGIYHIEVENDHHDNLCQTVLVSSPLHWCSTPDPGRNRSSIVLTHYKNGILNYLHYANAMGFLKDEPLPVCYQLLKYYLSDSDI
ncbi:PREDICTED: protein DOWNSTREAM OF FLC [Lupinus angustifolius]|uniref:protein DOWNSTREAM OF FLC n=1 Tax=Lupinus angustifolius TaxID=3871 RepID=UPI00092FD0AD|nr:PREDICTED: protein DOWNSTREAM OF FLC [Lupinus angustifolius]